jgi:hypothetical protein
LTTVTKRAIILIKKGGLYRIAVTTKEGAIMTNDKKYNGYTNYETWNCALWLDNEQYTNSALCEKAQELVDEMENPHDADEVTGTTSTFADFIKDMVDEMQELSEMKVTGMFADLMNAALSEIDYYDIAESQIADALRERQEKEPKAA